MTNQHEEVVERDELELGAEEIKDLDVDEDQGADVLGGASVSGAPTRPSHTK